MSHDHYLEPYRQSHRRHGPGFEVTLWASRKSQLRRFEIFSRMCWMGDKRVLDAGCSRGDFAEYLIQCGIPFERYIGVDALADVIEFARNRGFDRCEFHVGDLLSSPALLKTAEPQVIVISGTLNTMHDAQAMALLEESWIAAGETLLFNFLSDRATSKAPPQDGAARRLPTVKLIEWALAHTPRVSFRHDYFKHGHDATIMMRK